MDEWKFLDIEDIPTDIFSGCYEFEALIGDTWVKRNHQDKKYLLLKNIEGGSEYRFRKKIETSTGERILIKDLVISEISQDYSGKFELVITGGHGICPFIVDQDLRFSLVAMKEES